MLHNGPRRTHVIDSSGVSNTYGQDVLSDIAAGYAGLSAPCRCDYFKVGYSDGSDNGSLDQTVFSDTFDSVQINLTYDDAGNLTDDGIYIYKYDPWNRLVQVKRKSADGTEQVIATYTYDGLGRRIKKVVTNSGDRGRTEYFYYAGWQLVEVRNGSDIAERQFVWGTQYIDEAICMDVDTDSDGDCVDADGSKRYFYLQDANYNVIAIRRNSTIIERYEYDPYGNVRIFKGYDSSEGHEDMTVIGDSLVDNPILFAGYFYDNETGIYHVRHRMYSPALHRWLQRDFLGYIAGLQRYMYARANPARLKDPSGLFPFIGEKCPKPCWPGCTLIEEIQVQLRAVLHPTCPDAVDAANQAIGYINLISWLDTAGNVVAGACQSGFQNMTSLWLALTSGAIGHATSDPLTKSIVDAINSLPEAFIQMEGQVEIQVKIKWRKCVKEDCCGQDYKTRWESHTRWHRCSAKSRRWTVGDIPLGFPVSDIAGIEAAIPGCIMEAIHEKVWK